MSIRYPFCGWFDILLTDLATLNRLLVSPVTMLAEPNYDRGKALQIKVSVTEINLLIP